MLKGRKPVSDYVREKYAGYYQESNARLAQTVAHPLDISSYS
jgi:hypothetical protein